MHILKSPLAVAVYIGTALILIGFYLDKVGCHSRWGAAFQPQYGIGGCTIMTKDGRIPEAHYRTLN